MDYWKIIEFANWGKRTDYKKIGKEMFSVFKPEIIKETEEFYREKLSELKDILKNHAEKKTGNRHGYYTVSDDGFWDLRAHIIGLGKEYYNQVLENPELAKELADNRGYVENFGYIFNYMDE